VASSFIWEQSVEHLNRITQQPDLMGGKARIRGMRVTVGMIVGQIGAVCRVEALEYLMHWLMRKYKRLARHKTRARQALGQLALKFQDAVVHWKLGCVPKAG
jgi:Protein of unknown function (DUF433)